MEFKIDTKSSYTQITTLDSHIDANLTASLREKCQELTESGSENFIIDMSSCTVADNKSFLRLSELHEECYEIGQSLVFTNLQEQVYRIYKETEDEVPLNVAPTLIEAIDIVSMEILERYLFDEE